MNKDLILLSIAELIVVIFRLSYGNLEDLRYGTRCDLCDDAMFEERIFAYVILPLMTIFVVALLRLFVIIIMPNNVTIMLISTWQSFAFIYLVTSHMDRYLFVTLTNPVAILLSLFAALNINVLYYDE